MKNKQTLRIVVCALFAALACVSTMIIQVPSPMNGYVNLGDAIVLLGAFLLGPALGAAAGGIGSCLADLFLGYALYAPATLVIKALMGFVGGIIFKSIKNKWIAAPVGGVAAESIMVVGYFAYAALVFGKGLGAAASIPGNLMQALFGIVASFILYHVLIRNKSIRKFLDSIK